jgi:hypothetical protein
VNIDDYRKSKEDAFLKELEEIFEGPNATLSDEVIVEAHDRILDVAEQEFEDAVIVGILNKKILVSSTSQDKYFLEAMLEEALWSIRNEY